MRASTVRNVGAAIALALLAASAAAQRLDQPTPLPPGSSWVHLQHDSGSFGSGIREVSTRVVEMELDGRPTRALQSAQGTLLTTANGEWIAAADQDGKMVITWDPPLGFEWPLEVGKSWKRQHQVKIHASGATLPMDLHHTVEAYEEVTVPAGTFKAFRVKAIDTLGNESLNWFSPDLRLFVKRDMVRTEKNQQGTGRRIIELKSREIAPQ